MTETLRALGMDHSKGMPADRVAPAYVSAVEGTERGETINPR